MRAAGVILAAGAGSRFGGGKLLARVDGAPLLAHVVDAARGAGLTPLVVVLSAETARHAPALGIAAAEIVSNPDPGRGQSSSLRLGLAAAAAAQPPVDAAVILLGDQPLVRPTTIRRLLEALGEPGEDVALTAYAEGGGPNPVALRRAAFPLAAEASGDRGLGPLLAGRPGLHRAIPVPGSNPDIDTPEDLARLAQAAWARRVGENREQVDRVREAPDGSDFYAPVSSIFRDDPDRTGDPVLDALRRHVRPADHVLDIGAGAGRYALPLARAVRRVVAIDPSASMLGALREAMADHAISNVLVIEDRWPDAAVSVEPVDVSLIAHVGYDVEAIGPFLGAMEAATRRTCLAVMMERTPASIAEPFWPPVHGESRVPLPALPAFVDLLVARGRTPSVELVETTRRRWNGRGELEGFIRRQTWTSPGSAKDGRMLELLDSWLVTADDGSVELSVGEPLTIGLVAWSPASSGPREATSEYR